MKKIFLLAAFLLVSVGTFAGKVVGYMDVNLSEAEVRMNNMTWSNMTDFIYGFITPDASGNLPNPTTLKLFTEIQQKCIANGVDLHFSSGGAANSGMFNTLGANPSATANFARQVADLLETYDMEGWDLDWEFPRSAQEQVSQVNILKAVHDEFTSRGKRDVWKIGIAVGGETPSVGAQGVYHTDYCSPNAFQYIDFLYMMSYDIGRNISNDNNHSSYEDAVNNVIDWQAKGCPIEKMVLGVPFYARHRTSRGLPSGSAGFYSITYGYQSQANPALYFNQNNNGDFYYNGAPLLRQKVDYIMQNGGAGIMIWEVTYDRFDDYSLLKALHDKMEEYRCSAPTPDLGADESICGVSSVILDGGLSQASGRTFTWIKDDVIQVDQSPSAINYSATSTGTYTLQVWENGCNRSDNVEVTGVLSAPSLGGPYELCDPTEVTLDAAVNESGRTITWSLNNQLIAGANSSTLTAKKGGSYEVTVSANGCSSVSATAVVNSDVPYAESDTVCLPGMNAYLEASEEVRWYATEAAESPMETGDIFEPTVNNNTTYWMSPSGSPLTQYSTLGSSVGDGWNAGTANYGRKIEVISQLSIDAISVTAAGAGSVTINLKESDGQTIARTVTASVSAGSNEISLNWNNVAPGEYFIDAMGSAVQLKIGAAVASSDFTIPGIFFSEDNGYADWGGGYSATTNYSFFYGLKITAGKECAKVPVNVVVDENNLEACLTVSTNDVNVDLLKIYPNPSNANFNVVTPANSLVNVFDVKGQLVSSKKVNAGLYSFGDALQAGVYFVNVISDSSTKVARVVKK